MIEADVFRALADPTRRQMLERLSAGEMSVSELKAGLSVSQPAVSQHLALLKGAGLVAERRDGRFTYYRVAPDGLAPVVDWLARYRAFWPQRVEKLKTLIERMSDDEADE